MNAVVIGILLMLILSLGRVNVIVAMTLSALATGLIANLGLVNTLDIYQNGLSGGAQIALSYAMLGAFAVAIAKSGLTDILANRFVATISHDHSPTKQLFAKYGLLGVLMLVSLSSQNIIPVHIAFIPILIPPLLLIFNHYKLDRRAVACVLTFGLATAYMVLPYGYGAVYLNSILHANLISNGLTLDVADVPYAMILPALGMLFGLVIAVFFSYRKSRTYQDSDSLHHAVKVDSQSKVLLLGTIAILVALATNYVTGSMILSGLVGVLIFTVTGLVKWNESQDIFSKGVAMMAMIGFIMISAQGFAAVIKATGEVDTLVSTIHSMIAGNKAIAAALILLVGLLITMGIGSSFSTVPIIAAIFAPLALSVGFSELATVALIGTAGALGDAGSPASDSTLGPTSGLNADGQHDHIKDSVIPTFIHFNIPLLIFGWIAAMIL